MAEAAILAPCASRKSIGPESNATAVSLPRGTQPFIETAWSCVLSGLPAQRRAADLYRGRGFGLSRESAARADAALYVISAGLGLVDGEREIPSYGVTVSDRGEESIARRVVGGFDPERWWRSVSGSDYSERLEDVARRHRGPLLVALTTPYATMIGASLGALPEEAIARLRLFGHGIAAALPPHLAPAVMPYDARLDAVLPGTRTDFSQRALRHFCDNVPTDGSLDAAASAAAVRKSLEGHEPPVRAVRPRRSDDDMVALIAGHLQRTSGVGRILRLVRECDGLACEQARFSRLYGIAMAQRATT